MKKLFLYTAIIFCTLVSCGKAIKSSRKFIRSSQKMITKEKSLGHKQRTWKRNSSTNQTEDRPRYEVNYYAGDNSDSED
jgi:hypothetical protein